MSKSPEKSQDARPLTLDSAFVAERVFPEAAAAFGPPCPPITKVLSTCDIVLDTNVLLLPYRAGQSSLNQVETALLKVRDSSRLFIPGRVAREFARLRPTKLAELNNALLDQTSRAQVPEPKSYPLLEGVPEYTALINASDTLRKAKDAYTKAANALLGVVRSWNGDDPVSRVYARLFTAECIRDLSTDQGEILKDLVNRYANDIPPGYKDSAKTDGGIGDLIIWLTILDIGAKRKKPLVFVTGEEKADWFHKSANQPFLARFELVDEYRRASGQPLYLTQMSELLELLKADKETIAEIQQEERREREQAVEVVECPDCKSSAMVLLKLAIGSSAVQRCDNCGERFHIHRGTDGLFTRRWGSRRASGDLDARISYKADAIVECPYCYTFCGCKIGTLPGDSAMPMCSACGSIFHAHRVNDGVVVSNQRGTSAPPKSDSPGR